MKTLLISFHDVKSYSPNFLFVNKNFSTGVLFTHRHFDNLGKYRIVPPSVSRDDGKRSVTRMYVWWRVSFAQRRRKSFSHWGETVRERAFFILRMFHSRQPHSMHHHRTEGHRLFMARMNAYTFCSSSRVSFRPNFFPSFNPSEKSTCIVCPRSIRLISYTTFAFLRDQAETEECIVKRGKIDSA